jgi:hypothetical protein
MKYLLMIMLASITFAACDKEDGDDEDDDDDNEVYNPKIDPADFVSSKVVTNEYYPIVPGKKYIYEGTTADGEERVEEMRLDKVKVILGINCIAVNFKAFLDGKMIEEAEDWYAQANDGNFWYFGEAVDNYDENGILTDHEGSWEAGIDGAKPGIIMLADPVKGKTYREEFLPGVAEDEAEVLETGKEFTIDFGTFSNCIVTKNWTDLEPGIIENKIYAPGIGLIREINLEDGTYIDLVAIE